MDIPSTRLRSPRTGKSKKAKALKKVPAVVLLRKKTECDAKALKIVERMMEPEVGRDWLLESLSQINRSHMEDVVEERSIVKLCGYALCDNPLTKVVNKQYQISTLRNKVYDVSRVKNYCSFSCYTAAEYLMEQMLTSPLWLRDDEEIPIFRILPKKNKELRSKSPPGVEIDLTGIKLPDETDESEEKLENATNNGEMSKSEEINSTNKNMVKIEKPTSEEMTTEAQSSDDQNGITVLVEKETEINSIETYSENSIDIQGQLEVKVHEIIPVNKTERDSAELSIENQIPVSETLAESSQTSVIAIQTKLSTPTNKSSENRKTERRKVRESKKTSISFDTLTTRVEQSFKAWITDETIRLLHGELSEKQKILESVNRQEKYAVLCKKLNHLQLEEEREETEIVDDLKPAPHFSVLQEEAKGLELKVRAFMEGKTTIDRDGEKIIGVTKEEDNEVCTVLPMIDIHAPIALRRRIFLDKLNKVLPDLLRALAISEQSSSRQYAYTSERIAAVKALVSTFSLSAENIIFRTAEWTLVALIIIKLLGIMDLGMKYLLGSKQATIHISMILMSYKLESNYLERLITSLTTPPNTNIEETEHDS